MPEMYQHGGSNWFDNELQLLYVVVKGNEPIDIRMVPVVQVRKQFGYFEAGINLKSSPYLALVDCVCLAVDRRPWALWRM